MSRVRLLLVLILVSIPAEAQELLTLCGEGAGGLPSVWTRGDDRISFLSGDVGIGTDAPETKLDVDGTVRADDFQIGSTSIDQRYVNEDQESSISSAMLKNVAVTGQKIANAAVGTDKLANNAVTGAKLANNTVTTAKLANAAVSADKLANNAVVAGKIANNAVTAGKLANNAVTAGKIASAAVSSAKIADNAVTKAKISNNAVGTEEIAPTAVTSGKLADLAVTTAKIVGAAVTQGKLANNSVSEGKLLDNAVTSVKIKNGAVGAVDINSNQVQERVDGTCEVGEVIIAINANGSVTCGRPVNQTWGTDWHDRWDIDGIQKFSDNCAPTEVLLDGENGGFNAGSYRVTVYGVLGSAGNHSDPYEILFEFLHESHNLWKKVGTGPDQNYPDGSAPFSYSVFVTKTDFGPIRARWNCGSGPASNAKVTGYLVEQVVRGRL